MSLYFPERPIIDWKQPPKITIIASRYNAPFVDPLLEQAIEELKEMEPQTEINIIRVQGAFEIPALTKMALEKQHPDAIIALGVIIKGETAHADLIATAITNALMQLSLDYARPVIHEVLLLNKEEQAIARCLTESSNRGVEAARASFIALQAVHLLQSR